MCRYNKAGYTMGSSDIGHFIELNFNYIIIDNALDIVEGLMLNLNYFPLVVQFLAAQ